MPYRCFSASVAILLLCAPGWGATFEVDTTEDVADAAPGDGVCASSEGACGLRAAIEEANALPGEDAILLPAGEFEPAPGAPTLLEVEEALTLAGAGLEQSVLRTFEIVVVGGATGPFLFRDFSLLDSAGTDAAITLHADFVDTHFERVRVAGAAGRGIRCTAEFDIPVFDQVTVEENAQTGIWSGGGAIVRDSRVRNNGSASLPLFLNVGIWVAEEELILERSVVSGNHGGGVRWNDDSSLFRDSLIEDNGGPGMIGGHASGGVIDTIVRRNRGGGIRAGHALVYRSAIYDNESEECGGGVFLGAGALLIATTVSGNSAPVGGGLCHQMDPNLAFGGLRVLGSTITGNRAVLGGGVAIVPIGDWQGPLRLHESIVAGNEAAESPDCAAPLVPPPFSSRNPPTLVSQGGNLIGDATGCEVSPGPGDQLGNAASPIDPRLGPLADNGGPTPTHALLEGSPALDAIAPGDCDMTSLEIERDGLVPPLSISHDTDQRGVARPQGSACDVGAFERVEPLAVEIDVRPFQRHNRINLLSRGWVAVALLGSAELDVSEVEAETLRFGAEGAPAALVLPHAWDWDRDGYTDLLALFRIQATGIEPGDVEACLSGQTAAGLPFEGCDGIQTWPRPPRSWMRR